MAPDPARERRTRVVSLLRAFAATDSGLGRLFAQQQRMHPSEAAAVVEILGAETHGEVMTPARLAGRIGLTAGATSSLLNRLEGAGHVRRSREHRDRRVVQLHSTARVHAEAAAFFAPIGEALDSVLQQCSDQELASVERVVTAMSDALTQAAAQHREAMPETSSSGRRAAATRSLPAPGGRTDAP